MIIRRRVGLPAMSFHVMNRGARQQSIFLDDSDRESFLKLMVDSAADHKVLISTSCLMPNHYHMLLHSDGDSLVDMMRDLDRTYAEKFNRKHGKSGCVFQGRFRSTAPGDGITLAYVNRYIHCNPKDLGIRPEDYRWSTCRYYLGLESPPAWLNMTPVLDLIREPGKSDFQSYREYLASAPAKIIYPVEGASEFEHFYFNLVRHLEEVVAHRVYELESGVWVPALKRLVCWVARRKCRIPVDIMARRLGYSPAAARVIGSQVEDFFDEHPEVRVLLEGVNI